MDRQTFPGIQVARAIAALSVMYFHSWTVLTRFPADTAYPIPLLSNYGWLGVDLFFAVSGFVICVVVSRSEFNTASFLTNRVLRIYPLWLLTLTLFAVLALSWRKPVETETIGYFLYSATLLPTIEFPFYNIGWSLQYEMMFYLLAAAIVPIFGVRGLIVALAVVIVSLRSIDLPSYLYNSATYFSEFLVGVLAFLFLPQTRRLGAVPSLLFGSLLLWFFMTIWGNRPYVPIALFFLITGFANLQASRWIDPLAHTGDASYSIYLIHPLAFLVASAFISKMSLPVWSEEPVRFASMLIIICISQVNFHLFEKPFIRLGKRVAKGKAAAVASA
jgi:exopolysaccharide production protein ExoZ